MLSMSKIFDRVDNGSFSLKNQIRHNEVQDEDDHWPKQINNTQPTRTRKTESLSIEQIGLKNTN